MILNLNKLNVQKPTQTNLLNSQSFLLKNKITVNNVTHTHYTVEGVQMYSPAQLKALKQTQQKSKNVQNKQPVQIKLYQIADYFDQFEETKKLNPKEKVEELLRTKYEKDLSNKSFINKLGNQNDKGSKKDNIKITVKQKLQKNNTILTKLQKHRTKKDTLQKKLAQLSKQYKQYFGSSKNQQQNLTSSDLNSNSSDIKQDSEQKSSFQKSGKKVSPSNNDLSEEQSDQQKQTQETKAPFSKKIKSQKINAKNKKSLSNSSSCMTKPTNKTQQNKDKQDSDEENDSKVQFEDVQEGLDIIGEIICNRSTYSQKLGSAVHSLFN